MSKEFFDAVKAIEAEKGIPPPNIFMKNFQPQLLLLQSTIITVRILFIVTLTLISKKSRFM